MGVTMRASIIVHTKQPTIHDRHPVGTIWKVGGRMPTYFIQVRRFGFSRWVTLGEFLESSLGEFWMKEHFVKRCLDVYLLKEAR